MQLINADSGHYLKGMKENSIDSIVCDPPYGINFLGKSWDKTLPKLDIWKECLRVLRPGGYILAFSAARLYHHLAVDMERCGFITHPMLGWLYGSGFPKATNLSRELDKKTQNVIPDDEFRNYLRKSVKAKGFTFAQLERILGIEGMFSHYVGKSQPQYPNFKVWKRLKEILELDDRYDEIINSHRQTERLGFDCGSSFLESMRGKHYEQYEPQTKEGQKWAGYKYGRQCLKPALEPIYMGQKPFEKKMVDNVRKWGVGALNIEGCRIKNSDEGEKLYNSEGRYPSNILHDGSIDVLDSINDVPYFYCAKPTPQERGKGNNHPTVKPIKLMSYLIKLVTPEGGTCLDPFVGSGTTALAALTNGFDFIGVEKSREYFNLANKRIKHFQTYCGFES